MPEVDLQQDPLAYRFLELISIPPERRHELFEEKKDVIRDARALIEALTGVRYIEWLHEANNGTTGLDPKHVRFKGQVLAALSEKLPYLRIFTPEGKMVGLRELASKTNNMFAELRRICYPEKDIAKKLEPLDNLASCSDPGKLLLHAFNRRRPIRANFEALRQVIAMMHLAYTMVHKHEEIVDEGALDEFWDFAEEHLLPANPDELFTRFAVGDFRLPESEDGEIKPAELVTSFVTDSLENVDMSSPNRRVLEMICRQTRNGVLFMATARPKSPETLALKAIYSGKDIASRAVDQNGIQQIFENRESWVSHLENTLGALIEDIKLNLRKMLVGADQQEKDRINGRLERLEKANLVIVKDETTGEIKGLFLSTREVEGGEIFHKNPNAFFANFAARAGKKSDEEDHIYSQEAPYIDDTIIVYQIKDTMNGGIYSGSRPDSSDKFRSCKGKIEIRRSDGKKRHYEKQGLTADDYMSNTYGEASWDEYNIRRSFKLMRLFYPQWLYGIDHDEGERQAIQRHRRSLGFVTESELRKRQAQQEEDEALAAQ